MNNPQVNYGKRQLDCVYQLHTGAINAIQINEGFCVTASDDKFVRVWPVDFSDFFLEVGGGGDSVDKRFSFSFFMHLSMCARRISRLF